MNIFQKLKDRGLITLSTDEDNIEKLLQSHITCYTGFDPTARSLTLGHLVPLTLLKCLQEDGHNVIVLLGGATAAIGDPTGKTATRPVLEIDQIQENIASQTAQIKRILGDSVIIVNNMDWLSGMGLIDFLRGVAPYFSVNQMINNEVYASRLENQVHLSFSEFSYQLLQGYDWWYLFNRYHCVLQCAGTDQWANCLAGADLIAKKGGYNAHVMCAPLLTTSDGRKMGKTEGGVIWLDKSLTSSFDFYQYIVNIVDDDAFKLAKLLLDYDVLTTDYQQEKHSIAYQITEMVHGKQEANSVKSLVENHFYDNKLDDLDGMNVVSINSDAQQLTALDIFTLSGICKSRGDVRRLIDNQGLFIDYELVESSYQLFNVREIKVLKIGKNKLFRLEVSA
jgi:tyrosyl-tRNA synthetase